MKTFKKIVKYDWSKDEIVMMDPNDIDYTAFEGPVNYCDNADELPLYSRRGRLKCGDKCLVRFTAPPYENYIPLSPDFVIDVIIQSC